MYGGRVATILASRDKCVRFVVLYLAALGSLRRKVLSSLKIGDLKRLEEGEAVSIGAADTLRSCSSKLLIPQCLFRYSTR